MFSNVFNRTLNVGFETRWARAGEVVQSTPLAALQAEADSLDTLEAMMELEDHFKVELEDEWMEQAQRAAESQRMRFVY